VELMHKIKLLVDNKSTIDLAIHPTSHGRSKHIENRFHFLHEQVNDGNLYHILRKNIYYEKNKINNSQRKKYYM